MPDMEYSFMLEQDLITASAEDDIICAAAYTGEELAAGTFKTDFQRTSFTSCRFAGCDFSGSSFFDTSFTNCYFSNSRFSGCYFKNCSMNGCKGDGCDFSQVPLSPLSWKKAPIAMEIFQIHYGKILP